MAVALELNLATAEQIGDCRDSFLRVLGAGADGENEVAEGESALLEELIVLFHTGCALSGSKSDARTPD